MPIPTQKVMLARILDAVEFCRDKYGADKFKLVRREWSGTTTTRWNRGDYGSVKSRELDPMACVIVKEKGRLVKPDLDKAIAALGLEGVETGEEGNEWVDGFVGSWDTKSLTKVRRPNRPRQAGINAGIEFNKVVKRLGIIVSGD